MQQREPKEPAARRVLNTRDAAAYIGRTAKTLETWRTHGRGPRYAKLGKSVGYPIDYLDSYIEESSRSSTSDTGAGS